MDPVVLRAQPLPSPSNVYSKSFDYAPSPYHGLGLIPAGMTGYILQLDHDRVVKVARTFPLDQYNGDDHLNMEYAKSDNRDALKREKAMYERLGSYKGVIHCFKASDDGIELAFAEQGDLETYI